jgi:hypothetical protein
MEHENEKRQQKDDYDYCPDLNFHLRMSGYLFLLQGSQYFLASVGTISSVEDFYMT